MNMKDYLQFLKLENELRNTCKKFMTVYFPGYYDWPIDWSLQNVSADTETVFISIQNEDYPCMSTFAEVPTPILLDEDLWDVWIETNPYHLRRI